MDNNPLASLADEIPEARQGVTSHERLWAHMDTLLEDSDRAREAQKSRMISSTAHVEALDQLHKLQIDFAKRMLEQDKNLGIDHYKELWNVGDPDVLCARLFDDPYFQVLEENVSKSSAAITALADAMSRVNTRPLSGDVSSYIAAASAKDKRADNSKAAPEWS